MNRINLIGENEVRNNLHRNIPSSSSRYLTNSSVMDSIAWGKINFGTMASPLVFAATLIVCSLAVGCSNEKPKTEAMSSSPITTPNAPPVNAAMSAPPVQQPETKPLAKKIVHRAAVTAKYTDKSSGVSFRYPRKYSLKTGDAAKDLVGESFTPMDFVQAGGVALAAVAIPEGTYPKSDLESAFFNVSINKGLTAEQCGEFPGGPVATTTSPVDGGGKPAESTTNQSQAPKLTIGDMELRSLESLASVGTDKEASKYYHVFQNGACYEFALKIVTTGEETDEGGKPVNRDEVFKRLQRILATVKIDAVKAPEVTASVPVADSQTTPAQ